MLPVLKPSTGKNDWEVGIIVNIGIAHMTAIENHCVIKQVAIHLIDALKIPQELTEQLHLCGFNFLKPA